MASDDEVRNSMREEMHKLFTANITKKSSKKMKAAMRFLLDELESGADPTVVQALAMTTLPMLAESEEGDSNLVPTGNNNIEKAQTDADNKYDKVSDSLALHQLTKDPDSVPLPSTAARTNPDHSYSRYSLAVHAFEDTDFETALNSNYGSIRDTRHDLRIRRHVSEDRNATYYSLRSPKAIVNLIYESWNPWLMRIIQDRLGLSMYQLSRVQDALIDAKVPLRRPLLDAHIDSDLRRSVGRDVLRIVLGQTLMVSSSQVIRPYFRSSKYQTNEEQSNAWLLGWRFDVYEHEPGGGDKEEEDSSSDSSDDEEESNVTSFSQFPGMPGLVPGAPALPFGFPAMPTPAQFAANPALAGMMANPLGQMMMPSFSAPPPGFGVPPMPFPMPQMPMPGFPNMDFSLWPKVANSPSSSSSSSSGSSDSESDNDAENAKPRPKIVETQMVPPVGLVDPVTMTPISTAATVPSQQDRKRKLGEQQLQPSGTGQAVVENPVIMTKIARVIKVCFCGLRGDAFHDITLAKMGDLKTSDGLRFVPVHSFSAVGHVLKINLTDSSQNVLLSEFGMGGSYSASFLHVFDKLVKESGQIAAAVKLWINSLAAEFLECPVSELKTKVQEVCTPVIREWMDKRGITFGSSFDKVCERWMFLLPYLAFQSFNPMLTATELEALFKPVAEKISFAVKSSKPDKPPISMPTIQIKTKPLPIPKVASFKKLEKMASKEAEESVDSDGGTPAPESGKSKKLFKSSFRVERVDSLRDWVTESLKEYSDPDSIEDGTLTWGVLASEEGGKLAKVVHVAATYNQVNIVEKSNGDNFLDALFLALKKFCRRSFDFYLAVEQMGFYLARIVLQIADLADLKSCVNRLKLVKGKKDNPVISYLSGISSQGLTALCQRSCLRLPYLCLALICEYDLTDDHIANSVIDKLCLPVPENKHAAAPSLGSMKNKPSRDPPLPSGRNLNLEALIEMNREQTKRPNQQTAFHQHRGRGRNVFGPSRKEFDEPNKQKFSSPAEEVLTKNRNLYRFLKRPFVCEGYEMQIHSKVLFNVHPKYPQFNVTIFLAKVPEMGIGMFRARSQTILNAFMIAFRKLRAKGLECFDGLRACGMMIASEILMCSPTPDSIIESILHKSDDHTVVKIAKSLGAEKLVARTRRDISMLPFLAMCLIDDATTARWIYADLQRRQDADDGGLREELIRRENDYDKTHGLGGADKYEFRGFPARYKNRRTSGGHGPDESEEEWTEAEPPWKNDDEGEDYPEPGEVRYPRPGSADSPGSGGEGGLITVDEFVEPSPVPVHTSPNKVFKEPAPPKAAKRSRFSEKPAVAAAPEKPTEDLENKMEDEYRQFLASLSSKPSNSQNQGGTNSESTAERASSEQRWKLVPEISKSCGCKFEGLNADLSAQIHDFLEESLQGMKLAANFKSFSAVTVKFGHTMNNKQSFTATIKLINGKIVTVDTRQCTSGCFWRAVWLALGMAYQACPGELGATITSVWVTLSAKYLECPADMNSIAEKLLRRQGRSTLVEHYLMKNFMLTATSLAGAASALASQMTLKPYLLFFLAFHHETGSTGELTYSIDDILRIYEDEIAKQNNGLLDSFDVW